MSAQARGLDLARTEFTGALLAACQGLGVSLTEGQIGRLWQHYALMVDANQHTNLTRITAPAQAAVKHYADSLALLPWADRTIRPRPRVLDVGTGAGFPAVPLAVCCSTWRMLAIDGTRKKARFVANAAASLGLTHLAVEHARARELTGRVESFDLVVARAISGPLGCLRETRGLIAPGGWFVSYTTPDGLEGLTGAQRRQAERLGFAPPHRHDYTLSADDERIDRVLAAWQRR